MGNRGAIAHQLECFAFLALARGDRVRVARLFGAAESLRESAGAGMASHEREEYEAAVTQMRLDANGPALDGAWAEGRQMGAEAAVQYAVAQDERNRISRARSAEREPWSVASPCVRDRPTGSRTGGVTAT